MMTRFTFILSALLSPLFACTSHASLIAQLNPVTSLTIPEGGSVTFNSSISASSGHIGSGGVSYSSGGPAIRDSGPSGYSLSHGSTTVSSPGSTTWTYRDNGTFTHRMNGSGTEHNSSHQTIWSGSFSSQSSARETVNVVNVNPTLADYQFLSNPSATYFEGQVATMRFEATDPGFFDDISFLLNGDVAGIHDTDTLDPRILQLGVPLTQPGFSSIVPLVAQARDKDGGLSNTIAGPTLHILNRDPIIQSLTGNLTVAPDENFTFFVTATDPGNDPLSYRWDLDNDGQFDDLFNPGGQHSFSLVGTHPISLIVQDDGGGSTTRTFQVTVVPEPSALGLVGIAGIVLAAWGRNPSIVGQSNARAERA